MNKKLKKSLNGRLKEKVLPKAIFDITEDIILNIPTENILVETQIRKSFNEKDIESLAQSIKEIGLINPVTVIEIDNGKYKLIAGERRFRAVKKLKLEKIKARVIRGDIDKLTIQLIENLQREDLSPYEKAEGILNFIKKNLPEQNVSWLNFNNLLNLLVKNQNNTNTPILECLQKIENLFNISKRNIFRFLIILLLPEELQEYFKNKPYLPYYISEELYSVWQKSNNKELILSLLNNYKNERINITELLNNLKKLKDINKKINKVEKKEKEKRYFRKISSLNKKINNIVEEIKNNKIKIKDKEKVAKEIEKLEKYIEQLKKYFRL